MKDFAKQFSQRGRGDSGRSASLFFVACASFAILVAALSVLTSLGRRDTLLRHAPRTSVFYMHASGASAERVLALSAGAPTDVHPNEVAFFAMPREDGTLEQGTLLAWSGLRAPSAEEQTTLDERGAVTLNDRTYVLGDATVSDSLSDDEHVRRALSVVRSASVVQAFVIPSALQDREYGEVLKGFEPFVIGARLSDRGFTATLVPIGQAVSYGLLGWHMPNGNGRATGITASNAALAVTQFTPDFSPFDLLFRTNPGAAPDSQATAAAEAPEARLRSLLESPVTLSLAPGSPEDEEKALLHYPTVDSSSFSEAIQQYAAAAWPSKEPLLLPDRQTISELRLEPGKYRFEPIDPSASPVIAKMEIRKDLVIALSSDGDKGSLLSNDVDFLKETASESVEFDDGCPDVGGQTILLRFHPQMFKANVPLLSGMNKLMMTDIGDNMVFFCGYEGVNVDKKELP